MDQKALHNLTYGLYLLTARQDGFDNGCIINTAVQVANDPVRISVSVSKGGKTHDMICDTGAFCLSALTKSAPYSLFQNFGMQSGKDADKFSGFEDVARSSTTVLHLTKYANAYFCAVVDQQIDLGSHTLFIAEVIDAAVLSMDPSCTYAHYQANIKPRKKPSSKPQWECTVCGYVYRGEDLPEDYVCPICKHPKEDFVKQ